MTLANNFNENLNINGKNFKCEMQVNGKVHITYMGFYGVSHDFVAVNTMEDLRARCEAIKGKLEGRHINIVGGSYLD